MKNKMMFAAMSLVAIFGVTTALAAPASAAYSDCPAGIMCAWDGGNGTGTRWQFPFSVYGPVDVCRSLVGHGAGGISSARNGYGTGLHVVFYTESGCKGLPYGINNGQSANILSDYNNRFQSFEIFP